MRPGLYFSSVSQKLPVVTVIIAAPPDMAEVKAVAAARQMNYPAESLEIIIARGRQPSVQRNKATQTAAGEWIYFLDDDSIPQPQNLRQAAIHFHQSEIAMIGGPNICPPEASFLEKVFALVLASWLAFGPSRARYTPVGKVRATGEKELILCNLIVRRRTFLESGGFNESLYPNEENALMDELQKRNFQLIYNPQILVHRRPRRTMKAFLKMLFNYGRGRAEQFRVHPTPGSALNFVPPIFCLYLVLLLLVEIGAMGHWSSQARLIFTLPLGFYLIAVILQTIVSMRFGGLLRGFLTLPLLAASHVLYGFGFWRGLFTRLKNNQSQTATEVVLQKL